MKTLKLSNKIAVVTGGSRGIGRAIVEALVKEGARVFTCGRGKDPDNFPTDVEWKTADVSKPEDVDELARTVTKRFRHVDILVNNAGVQIEKTVTDTSDEDWDTLIGINAKGVFLMFRRFIPLLLEGGGGSIINVGSISGNHADPSMAIYNASKAFVHGLTRSIAVDHGHQRVRCNAICPGWILTGMADAAFVLAKNQDAAKADALARHPARRFGQPDDLARAAV